MTNGVTAAGYPTIIRSVVLDNGAGGIFLGNYGLVSQTVASRNQGDGINVSAFVTILDNQVTQNTGTGVRCLSDCLVRGNLVYLNAVDINAVASTVIENHP